MRLPHHLVRQRCGIFHFRLIVPADLREAVKRRVIKRSLRTCDPRVAVGAALSLWAGYARAFAHLRRHTMPDDFDLDGWLREFSPGVNIYQYELDMLNGKIKTDGTEMDAEAALKMVREYVALRAYRESINPAPAASPSPEQAAALIEAARYPATLREAINHWKTVDMKAMRNKTTANTREDVIEDFAGYVGDLRRIYDLQKADIARWVAYLRTSKQNSQSTAKTKSSHVVALFEAAQRAGMLPEERKNPAAKVVDFTKTDQEDRAETHGWQAFTTEQLQTIFKPENLKRAKMMHTRRAAVIGLYTGARVGEIAQLRLDGFKDVDGVACITMPVWTKTKASKNRVIPLHPDLVALGLPEWVEEQRARNSTRLFPTVKLDGKSGKGNAISKGFENLLTLLKIEPTIDAELAEIHEVDPIVGMHSFRDTLVHEFQSHKVNEELRKAYVGHSHEKRDRDAHKVSYMRKWKADEIAEVLQGIGWSKWLNLTELREVLKESDAEHEKNMCTKRMREATRARTAARKIADAEAASKTADRKRA